MPAGNKPRLDKTEAKKAYVLLNDIRQHPDKYFWSLSLSNLKISKTALVWNDTLARVAEQKVIDMATKNYFAHVDPGGYGINHYINKSGYKLHKNWLKEKKLNYFESLCVNPANGEDAIKTLIIDKDVPSFGHRNHLPGIGEWNSSLTDIGIGFAKIDSGAKYTTYVSVVIAKHN